MRLAELGEFQMAAWIVVGFGAYLRPSENMGLRAKDLIPPVVGITARWSLQLCPLEEEKSSKTGVFDETILWDADYLSFMGHVFGVLKGSVAPSAAIWSFSYPEFVDMFKAVVQELRVTDFVPYQLRHAGPSWERLQELRSQVQIMKRGRWRSFASVARYEKAGLITGPYGEFSSATRSHFEACAAELPTVLKHLQQP